MSTQADRILYLLKQAGNQGVPNYRLAEVSLQYNGRVHELRHKSGYDIRKTRVYNGSVPTATYMYYLLTPIHKVTDFTVPSALKKLPPDGPALFGVQKPETKQRMEA